jgi:predicted PolB exonuclease-like 3'-5' exonuclease
VGIAKETFMNHLIFDIETVRNEESGWEPPPDDPKRFAPVPAHRIVAIGGMILGFHSGAHLAADLQTFGIGPKPSEREMIDDLLRVWNRDHAVLVSYNGRRFDIPVILARMMRLGMNARSLTHLSVSHRYNSEKHFDLADSLTNFGAAPPAQLDIWCRSIGLPGKVGGVDGGNVQRLYDEGRIDDINAYVQCDVIQTGCLSLRWRFAKGELPQERYNEMIKAVLDLAREKDHPLIGQLLDEIDRGRLLLPSRTPEELREDNEQGDLPF